MLPDRCACGGRPRARNRLSAKDASDVFRPARLDCRSDGLGARLRRPFPSSRAMWRSRIGWRERLVSDSSRGGRMQPRAAEETTETGQRRCGSDRKWNEASAAECFLGSPPRAAVMQRQPTPRRGPVRATRGISRGAAAIGGKSAVVQPRRCESPQWPAPKRLDSWTSRAQRPRQSASTSSVARAARRRIAVAAPPAQ